MSAMYFRPVVTYPTRCVAPAFFARPAPVAHQIVPLFSLLDDSLAQLDNHLRQVQIQKRQFKRPFNPKFDVKENKESYSVEGELPGFDAKDISIEFLDDGHTLQIKGKTVKETKTERAPAAKAVESTPETSEKAVADAPATTETAAEANTSETSSLKSHQATVEDDVEEPANASAATATEQAVVETPKPAEQQVTEPVKAEQPQQQQPEAKNWISERYTGSFTRSFRFASKVDQETVRASLKDGILAITLPFARKPESRKIQIE